MTCPTKAVKNHQNIFTFWKRKLSYMNDYLAFPTSMTLNSLPDEEQHNHSELLRHLTSEFSRPSTGWNFSYLKGRMEEQLNLLPWNYEATVRALLPNSKGLLDMGTGSGEFLASLNPLPPDTCATEGWAPNIAIARQRLKPFGVTVTGTAFPVETNTLNDIIN